MKLNSANFLLAFVVLTASSFIIPSAQAGISDMINEFFTFRKEQKELVAPKRDFPPITVVTPYYDEEAANAWSRYYTRKDLEAVTYLDNSSVVMRPIYSDDDVHVRQSHERVMQTDSLADIPREGGYADAFPYIGDPYENAYGERTYRKQHQYNNLQQGAGRTIIDDARMVYNSPAANSQNLRPKTKIAEPKLSWKERNDGGKLYATPRAGDYDYQRKPTYVEEVRPSRASSYDDASGVYGYQRNSSNDRDGFYRERVEDKPSGYMNIRQVDRVNRYTVEEGDSLSGISGKEQIYGDWQLWPIIYDANSSQIEDPDLIHPGQNFKVPRDYNEREAINARERARAKHAPYDFYDRM